MKRDIPQKMKKITEKMIFTEEGIQNVFINKKA